MERIAVISDIHSCFTMLELVIKDAFLKGVDSFIFLGDFVTDGYNGNEVIKCIKSLQAKGYFVQCIKGNREKYILDYNPNDFMFNSRLNRKALAYESLTNDSISFIKCLDERVILNLSSKNVLLIHGDSFKKKMDIDNSIDLCLYGHYHSRNAFGYGNTFFINPGSISQSFDNDGFSYCIIDNLQRKYAFQIIPLTNNLFGKIFDEYHESNYLDDNFEWAMLNLLSIYLRIDYIGIFMQSIKPFILNKNISLQEFNHLFHLYYLEFINNYSLNETCNKILLKKFSL